MKTLPLALMALCLGHAARAEDPLVQPVIDGCIDRLIASGAATQPGGEVIDTMYSEAGTLVFLKDGDGRIWQCFGYRDGTVESLELADADAAEGAFARAAEKAAFAPERISFAPGTSGAALGGALEPGARSNSCSARRRGRCSTCASIRRGEICTISCATRTARSCLQAPMPRFPSTASCLSPATSTSRWSTHRARHRISSWW